MQGARGSPGVRVEDNCFSRLCLIAAVTPEASIEILQRVLRSHPPLKRHPARTGDCQPVAVRRRLTHRRRQAAMRAVEPEEVVELVGEIHGQ